MSVTKAKLDVGHFAYWLASGERGLSSEAIVAHLTGTPVGRYGNLFGGNHPHDPADFRRCENLLRAFPLARLLFRSMAEVSPEWAGLVEAWDELVALMESENPGVFENPRGSSPLTYARMQEILKAATS